MISPAADGSQAQAARAGVTVSDSAAARPGGPGRASLTRRRLKSRSSCWPEPAPRPGCQCYYSVRFKSVSASQALGWAAASVKAGINLQLESWVTAIKHLICHITPLLYSTTAMLNISAI